MSDTLHRQPSVRTAEDQAKYEQKQLELARNMIDYLLDELQPNVFTRKKDALDCFDTYFFKAKPLLPLSEIKRLLCGSDGTKGLMAACGELSLMSNKLRQSSVKCLVLLVKLLDKNCNPHAANFQQVYTSCDRSVYKNMKLDKHITGAGGKNNRQAALDALAVLRDVNSGLMEQAMADVNAAGANITVGHLPAASTAAIPNLATSPTSTSSNPLSSPPSSLSREPSKLPAQNNNTNPNNTDNKQTAKKTWMEKLSSFFGGSRSNREDLEKKGIIQQRKVFGATFSELQQAGDLTAEGVPLVLVRCCNFMRSEKIVELQGLFRLSGDAVEIAEMRKTFDTGGIVNLKECGAHSISGLVKLFLRTMPEPLLLFDNYDRLVSAYRNEQLDEVLAIVKALPHHHKVTLTFLLDFLAKVNSYHETNMMTENNLSICMAPNVLRARVESFNQIARDTPVTIGVLKYLIINRVQWLRAYGGIDIATTLAQLGDCATKAPPEGTIINVAKATNDEEADETSASAVASPKALPPKQPPPFIRPASSDRAINASQPIATSSASNAPPPLPRQPTQDGVKVASPAASPKLPALPISMGPPPLALTHPASGDNDSNNSHASVSASTAEPTSPVSPTAKRGPAGAGGFVLPSLPANFALKSVQRKPADAATAATESKSVIEPAASSSRTAIASTSTATTSSRPSSSASSSIATSAAAGSASKKRDSSILPECWKRFLDPNTKKYYYYNELTKRTTWKKPSLQDTPSVPQPQPPAPPEQSLPAETKAQPITFGVPVPEITAVPEAEAENNGNFADNSAATSTSSEKGEVSTMVVVTDANVASQHSRAASNSRLAVESVISLVSTVLPPIPSLPRKTLSSRSRTASLMRSRACSTVSTASFRAESNLNSATRRRSSTASSISANVQSSRHLDEKALIAALNALPPSTPSPSPPAPATSIIHTAVEEEEEGHDEMDVQLSRFSLSAPPIPPALSALTVTDSPNNISPSPSPLGPCPAATPAPTPASRNDPIVFPSVIVPDDSSLLLPPIAEYNENIAKPRSVDTTSTEPTPTVAVHDITISVDGAVIATETVDSPVSTATQPVPLLDIETILEEDDVEGEHVQEEAEWEEYTDESSGRSYYYNIKTGVTTWINPFAADTAAPSDTDNSASNELDNSSGDRVSISSSVSTSSALPFVYTITGKWNPSSGCYPNFPSWRENKQFQIQSPPSSCNTQFSLTWQPLTNAATKNVDEQQSAGFFVLLNSGPSLFKYNVVKEEIIARSEFIEGIRLIHIHMFCPHLACILEVDFLSYQPYHCLYYIIP